MSEDVTDEVFEKVKRAPFFKRLKKLLNFDDIHAWRTSVVSEFWRLEDLKKKVHRERVCPPF